MRLLYLTIFLISALPMLAQYAGIKGKVFSEKEDWGIPGVSVYLKGHRHGVSTNAEGIFEIKDIKPGSYKLIVSALNYGTKEIDIDLKEDQHLELEEITMDEKVSELSEVVISGGKSGIKDIPGSVQYLSPQDLDAFSYTDVNRSLRTVPGVNIQEEDGYGLRPNIGLRGSGVERSSKISLMEDGILIAPAPYVAPAAYYFPTIGRMNGLEIMKGSSQIQYGPFTTGGAINMISTPIPDAFSGNFNVMYGSFATQQVHASVGNKHKNVAYMVEAFNYNSDGFKELDNGGNTGFDKTDLLAKIRINTGPESKTYQSLTLKVGLTNENSNETYLGLTEEDFETTPNRRYYGSQKDKMLSEHRSVSLFHLIRFNDHIDLTTTAYRNEFDRNWYKVDKVSDSTGSYSISSILDEPYNYEDFLGILKGQSSLNNEELHVKANNRAYFSQGIQSKWTYSFATKNVSHNIIAGVRVHRDQMDRFQWVDDYIMDKGYMELVDKGIAGTESNRIHQADALAAFTQYRIKFSHLTVIPGLRYENIYLSKDDYGKSDVERTGRDLKTSFNHVDILIPGLGLDYQFNKDMSAFAGLHKGFAPPGATAGTLPEKSINYELGVRQNRKSLSWSVIAFYNDYENLLGSDLNAAGGNGTNETYNGGKAETMGLEFQLAYDFLSFNKSSIFRMPFSLAYTLTEGRFQNDFESDFEGWGSVSYGDELPYMSMHQFSAMLSLEHHYFSLYVNARYNSEMRTEPGQGPIPEDRRIDGFYSLDASASIHLHPNLSFFTSVTNFTNNLYVVARRPSGLRPGMPMAINMGLKARF